MTAGPRLNNVSGLRSHLGFWLRFVSNHVSHAFAKKLLRSGVTAAEWVVLRELYELGATASSVLAERMGVTRGAVSKLVDRLVVKKLITRRDRSDDRRFQDIELTAAGRKLVPQLAATADQNDKEFFESLSKAEREVLLRILRKLVDAHQLSTLPTN